MSDKISNSEIENELTERIKQYDEDKKSLCAISTIRALIKNMSVIKLRKVKQLAQIEADKEFAKRIDQDEKA